MSKTSEFPILLWKSNFFWELKGKIFLTWFKKLEHLTGNRPFLSFCWNLNWINGTRLIYVERLHRHFPPENKLKRLYISHLSTAVAWREKKCKHFVFYKYFCLILGLHKSRISKKSLELLLRKYDFNLFHYKARVQPVSKITTIAARNRC